MIVAGVMSFDRQMTDTELSDAMKEALCWRVEYYTGWHIHELGGMTCDCVNETQVAGWKSRRDNENWALLVADALKLKVCK